MSTIREQIITALVVRLGDIKTTAGYATNVGANALRAVDVPAESQLDYVTAWPQPEEAIKKYGKTVCSMPVRVEAAALFGATDPSVVIEQLLGDLIECLTGRQWSLSFSAGATEIVVGQTVTGVGAQGYVAGITLATGTWAGGDAAGTLTLRRQTGSFGAGDLKVAGSKMAETHGTATVQNPTALACGSLADEIAYTAGGPESWPAAGDLVCGVTAAFTIVYKTVIGNPFAQ